MRRLPPQGCEKHLTDLVALAPDLCESLLTAVDQPLKVAKGFIIFVNQNYNDELLQIKQLVVSICFVVGYLHHFTSNSYC